MHLPGRAWLQFEAAPNGASGSTLVQTAFFEPRGLFGYLYWYSVAPFHQWVFGSMAQQITRLADADVPGMRTERSAYDRSSSG
jgi:hypothetical protein